MFIFSVQLTTNRIGNLTGLMHNLLYLLTIHISSVLHRVVSLEDYVQTEGRAVLHSSSYSCLGSRSKGVFLEAFCRYFGGKKIQRRFRDQGAAFKCP